MRKAIIIFVLLCVLYFIGGWTLVIWGPISKNAYVISASIAGSFASALGLLSLTRPSLTKQDLKTVEMDTLKEIGQLGKQLEDISEEKERLSKEKNQTETELERLERQKREMEALVKKASLILLYENDLHNLKQQLEEYIQNNNALKNTIANYNTSKAKLEALQHEVETSEDAELLSWILISAKERETRLEQIPRKPTGIIESFLEISSKVYDLILRN